MHAAVTRYEEQVEGLGNDLQSEIERTVRRIQQHPQSFPAHNDQGIHKCLVRRFPYTLFYLELDEYIWIVAVAHHRRRPGYWAPRTPGKGDANENDA